MSKSGTTSMHASRIHGGLLGSYWKKPTAVPPSSKWTFSKCQVRSVACTCAAAKKNSEAVNAIRRTLLIFPHFYADPTLQCASACVLCE